MTTALSSFRLWPKTLGARLFLILIAGLAVAHALSFGFLFLERYLTTKAVMLDTLEHDVATSVAILDRLPAKERGDWTSQLDRDTYRYILGTGLAGIPDLKTRRSVDIAAKLRSAVPARYSMVVESIPGDGKRLQAHLMLTDGSPLTIDINPAMKPLTEWLPIVLMLQFGLLIVCSWFAVRLAIKPLVNLANAADRLDLNNASTPLNETGPAEVAYAAKAFNAMRERITQYLEERVQILASISHDLKTPITRMKLRAEMEEESPKQQRLLNDLSEIERLVHEGIAYAKSAHGKTEDPTRIDVGSFVESLVFDYQDSGSSVTLTSNVPLVLETRPHALRRVLTNLIDNAIKFGGAAEVAVAQTPEGLEVSVLDRGPGIPEDHLEAVLEPFVRLEESRNRGTGGTGLGLAIAKQLSGALGGSLVLSNRTGGGLCAKVILK